MKKKAFLRLLSSGCVWLLLTTAGGCDGKSDDGRPQVSPPVPQTIFLSLTSPKHLATGVKPESMIQLRITGVVTPEKLPEIEGAVSVAKLGGSAVSGKLTVAPSTEVRKPYFATFQPDEPLAPGDYLVSVKPKGHVEITKGVEQQYLFSVGDEPPRVASVDFNTKNGQTLSGGSVQFSEEVQIENGGVLNSAGEVHLTGTGPVVVYDDNPVVHVGISLWFNDNVKLTDTVKLTFQRSKVRSADRRIGLAALRPDLSTPNGATKVTVTDDSVEIELRPAELALCQESVYCWEPRTSVVN